MKFFLFSALLCINISAYCQDTLTVKDIPAAERVIGLRFKPSERDSLFNDVKNDVKEYEKMRQFKLDNSVPLSTWQSPVLPRMEFNRKQDRVKWNIPSNISLPKNKNELAFYSVPELASLIKNKMVLAISSGSPLRFRKVLETMRC